MDADSGIARSEDKMYTITIKKGFATIRNNRKPIEPLSGLFMASPKEIGELAELVRSANASRPIPARADETTLWECDNCKSYNNLRAIACAICGALREGG